MSVFYFIIYLESEQAFYSANVLIYSRTRGRQWYLRYVPVEPICSFSTCVNSSDIESIKNYTQRQQYWYFRASAILVHSIVSLWLGQDSPRSIKRLSWGKLVFQAGSTLHWHYSASWILCYNTHNIFQFGFKLSSYYKISQVWSSMFFSGPASRVFVSYGVRMDQISLRWKMILTWQLK